jgi:hypothetical protein
MTDTTLKDKLLVPASRVAKILVTAALTFGAVKWKLTVPPGYEWLRELIEQLIAVTTASGLAGLAVHYGVGIKANPRDTISPTEGKEGRKMKAVRKLARKHRAIDELVATAVDNDDDIPPLAKIPASEKGHP